MALLASRLTTAISAAIVSKIEAATGRDVTADAADIWDAVAAAIAEEVITELTTNGVVPVTVASVTLVTAGVAASGPGTGTGTIT